MATDNHPINISGDEVTERNERSLSKHHCECPSPKEDPSIPPQNGRAPILDLPDEILELILLLGFSKFISYGRPCIARWRTAAECSHMENYRYEWHARLWTCKRFYHLTHKAAYNNVEWNLDSFKDPYNRLMQDLTFPKTKTGQLPIMNFLHSLLSPIIRNVRYISGRAQQIIGLIQLLEDERSHLDCIDESQLRLAVWTLRSQCGGWDMFNKRIRAGEFWHCYLVWITHTELCSLEWLSTADDAEYPRSDVADVLNIFSQLDAEVADADGRHSMKLPAWIEAVVKEGDENFEGYLTDGPYRLAFKRRATAGVLDAKEAEGMLEDLKRLFSNIRIWQSQRRMRTIGAR